MLEDYANSIEDVGLCKDTNGYYIRQGNETRPVTSSWLYKYETAN